MCRGIAHQAANGAQNLRLVWSVLLATNTHRCRLLKMEPPKPTRRETLNVFNQVVETLLLLSHVFNSVGFQPIDCLVFGGS